MPIGNEQTATGYSKRSGELGSGYGTSQVTNQTSGHIDPEKEMAAIYKKQLGNFKKYQEPMIDSLQDSLNDRHISERGTLEANRLEARSQGMANRLNSGRADGLLASQQANQRSSITKAASLGSASINTIAKRTERSNRISTRQQLMSIGEQLAQTGTASMSSAAAAQAQREAQNKAASSSLLSQGLSMVGTVVGGIAGGPVGASIGGAVGGYVGGGG